MNRLSHATSPYLLQHAANPVHWWEWGPEALAEAERTGRPILLSVGYAACHWCHVMAHESFEDEETARLMNALFVNIKVDREERPDVDHTYMSALHATGEQGGWPLTMFLDPAGRPFWGGTYFPKDPSFGRPHFAHILRSISQIYAQNPDKVARNAAALTAALRRGSSLGEAPELDRERIAAIGESLVPLVDPVQGGLQGAPKFPNPPLLEMLARQAGRDPSGEAGARFATTLRQMARGGIHDQIGGGFSRYSVDERWLVPHFEKMLYDNAQLLELYALGWARTGEEAFRQAADGIVAWLAREMTLPGGGFASSLDADSEGEEGLFYVWTPAEIDAVLGEAAGREFREAYDITPGGNFEGRSIPNRLDGPALDPDGEARLAASRALLLAEQDKRVRPGLDDKVLADWNALMVTALVRAATILDRPDWITPAAAAHRFVMTHMMRDGTLGHAWRADTLVHPGFALDHAAAMRAALALHEATGETGYIAEARALGAVLERDYRDAATGLLAMSSAAGEALVARPAPTHDDAVPNANGVCAEALVRLAQITGEAADLAAAEGFLAQAAQATGRAALGHASIVNAADLHLGGVAVTIVGDADGALRQAAQAWPYVERSVAAFGAPGELPAGHPARALAEGLAGGAALVCAGGRCSLPVTEAGALRGVIAEMLGRAAPSSDPR